MANTPRFHEFDSLGPTGFHRLAYHEWGDPRDPHLVICVHGLTRHARDFDPLASVLADRCRVVCLDVVGRGRSDWLERSDEYGFDLYLSDAAALMARLTAPAPETLLERLTGQPGRSGVRRIDWIGTSMGGLIGMMLAAKRNTPIDRLVLNDVGPMVPWQALTRLKLSHAGASARFDDLDAVEAHLRSACASFGPLDDRRWAEVARHSARRLDDGRYALAFDPDIVGAMRHSANRDVEFGNDFLFGVDLWPVWDAIRCPTLVLRGAQSDLLLRTTADRMTVTGPKATVVELPGIGHAPWLADATQIALVRDFLFGSSTT